MTGGYIVNILVLSAGTRNKVIQYFKKSISGKVVATDKQLLAPAIYEADKYYIVPSIQYSNYIDIILDICKNEQIDAVISLIDPELSILAENIHRFNEIGVTFIGSSYELCEMALDKIEMYKWLSSHGYNCARSYNDKDAFYKDLNDNKISFPVFVKPIRGSASVLISKVENKEILDALWAYNSDFMIQEYLKGQEIGADVYVDMISGEVVSIFTKKKLLMKSGETDKAISFKDEKLFELIEKFVTECGWKGQIDIDIFDVDGKYYINEVNPRFGGGYPHAYECGCDHMRLIENNINGIANNKNIGDYQDDVCMMKYNEVMIKRK